jgi:hypothetical protein
MPVQYDICVGTVPVRVVTGPDVSPELREFLSAFPVSNAEPRLDLIFTDTLPATTDEGPTFAHPGAKLQAKSLRFTDYASPAGYVITLTEGKLTVHFSPNDASRLTWRQRLQLWQPMDPFFTSPGASILGTLIYGLWHWLMQVVLLQGDASFIHASCVEKDGQALLLPAWGGVGKTSLMYQMVVFGGWRFLADDLAILARDGAVYLNPDPIAVYPYNLLGLPKVREQVMRRQSALGRLQWQVGEILRGPSGVGRRMSPRHVVRGRARGAAGAAPKDDLSPALEPE